MKDSKLHRLLATLEVEDLSNLAKYVKSPYFNTRKEVIALLDVLEKPLKQNLPMPSKEQIFKKIFGKGEYDDHRVRLAMSFLYQASCQFMAIQSVLTNKSEVQYAIAEKFREKRLFSEAYKALDVVQELERAESIKNATFYGAAYQSSLLRYKTDMESRNQQNIDLQSLSDQLDIAFMTRKLWQACFMISHQNIGKKQYQYAFLDSIMHHIAITPTLLEVPAIAVYYHGYLMQTQPLESLHFQSFKQQLLSQLEVFPANEMRDLYVLAINFCIRQYNSGSHEYLKEQFDFYHRGLTQGYFISEGILSHYTFQNAITVGLVLDKLDWAESVIHRYQSLLDPDVQESVCSFNLARLEYKRKNLGKALVLLQKAEYKDILLSLAVRTLQIKIYYEMDEMDLLESHLQAFRAFLNRKNIIGYHRENYLNTVIFTQKTLECNPMDKLAKAALKKQIMDTKSVAEKEWLLGL